MRIHAKWNVADRNIQKTLAPEAMLPNSNQSSAQALDEDIFLASYISSDIEFSSDESVVGIQDQRLPEADVLESELNTLDPMTAALKQLYGQEATWRTPFQQQVIANSLQLQPN